MSPCGAAKLWMSATLLPDGTPELFSLYGGLLLVAAIASARTGDPWRARELLRDPARQAAERVGEGHNYHHTVFGPTNVAIHRVTIEHETGELSEALRLGDEVDITRIPSLGRQAEHLYQLARVYECKDNDTAVFVHLRLLRNFRRPAQTKRWRTCPSPAS